MKTDEGFFTVEKELQERLRRKYRKFKTKVIESGVGPHKVRIQRGIARKYLKISEEELKDKFKEYFGGEQKKVMKAPEPYLKRLLKSLTKKTR